MSQIKGWRKTGNNWVSGKKILNIRNIYRINTIIGYSVDLYDISKVGTLNQQRRVLKRFKTKKEALDYARNYMKVNPNG